MGFWWFFNVALLAAGTVSLSLSVIWRHSSIIMNLIVDSTDLTRALLLFPHCPIFTHYRCHTDQSALFLEDFFSGLGSYPSLR
jgi:hypothetical protein